MPERPLQHREPEKKDDETLRKEARAHLVSEPALQFMAELIAKLRELALPWWTPARLRERWGAVDRMRWFRDRSDVRQRVTTALTGLAPKAARRKPPDFQGALIDSVIDEADITPQTFEAAFDPCDIAVYGPASGYWHFFRESMPWDQDIAVHQQFIAWLLKSLLADRSPFDDMGRAPILTPWDVRTAIAGRVWHTKIPLEIRVAIDDARLQQERDRPGVPFHAEGDLGIAIPEIIAANIPLQEVIPVLLVAQKSMRFEPTKLPPQTDNDKPRTQEPPSRTPEPASPPAAASVPTLSTTPATDTSSPAKPAASVPPSATTPPPTMTSPSTVAPVSAAAVSTSVSSTPAASVSSSPPGSSSAAPPAMISSTGASTSVAPSPSSPGSSSAAPPAVISSTGASTSVAPSPPPLVTPTSTPAGSISATPPPMVSSGGSSSSSVAPPPPALISPASSAATASTLAAPPALVTSGPSSSTATVVRTPSVPPPALVTPSASTSAVPTRSPSVPPPPMVPSTKPIAEAPPPTLLVEPPRFATSSPHVDTKAASQPPPPRAPMQSVTAVLAVLNSMDNTEDDLERTNPWVVPTPDEVAAADAARAAEAAASPKKRRPTKS